MNKKIIIRISALLITAFLFYNNAVAAQRCSLGVYSFSEDGGFELPLACDGVVSVRFDSESDLGKLKALDSEAHSKLMEVLGQLAVEKTAKHRAVLVEAGAEGISTGGAVTFTSHPPIKSYRFSIGNYVYLGEMRLNPDENFLEYLHR